MRDIFTLHDSFVQTARSNTIDKTMSTIRSFVSQPDAFETSSTVDSSLRQDICIYETCPMQKYDVCAHCNHQFCFGHLLNHHEQLSINTHRHRLAIDQLGK